MKRQWSMTRPMDTMEQTQQVTALLERARQEAGEWLEKLELGEEDPRELLPADALELHSPQERFSPEYESAEREGDAPGNWYIGLAGHGWNNIYFCCRLRTPGLKVSVQVSYQTLLTAGDLQAAADENEENRKRMREACALVCYLLKVELENWEYIQENVKTDLTVTFDNAGCAFCLRDADGKFREDTTVDTLLYWLENYSMIENSLNDMVIIRG